MKVIIQFQKNDLISANSKPKKFLMVYHILGKVLGKENGMDTDEWLTKNLSMKVTGKTEKSTAKEDLSQRKGPSTQEVLSTARKKAQELRLPGKEATTSGTSEMETIQEKAVGRYS